MHYLREFEPACPIPTDGASFSVGEPLEAALRQLREANPRWVTPEDDTGVKEATTNLRSMWRAAEERPYQVALNSRKAAKDSPGALQGIGLASWVRACTRDINTVLTERQ